MALKLQAGIEQFEAYMKYERHLSPLTVLGYIRELGQFRDYLSGIYEIDSLDLIESKHIRSWLAELRTKGLKSRSLKRKIAALNSFYKFLIRKEIIKENPARKIVLPKEDKPLPAFLNEKQTEELANPEWYPDDFEGFTRHLIIELLYQTGMRRAELINFKESDIDFSRRELHIWGKGSKMRILPISRELSGLLKHYLQLKEELFANPDKNVLSLKSGKKLYPKYVYRIVNYYLSKVTTMNKKSPHVLRHTFATHLLNNGADLMAIKELLGHSSLAATQIYTHLDIEKLKEIYKKAHPKS